jgi:hypothetical protein
MKVVKVFKRLHRTNIYFWRLATKKTLYTIGGNLTFEAEVPCVEPIVTDRCIREELKEP